MNPIPLLNRIFNTLPQSSLCLALFALAILPLLITAILRGHFVAYKQSTLHDELEKLRALDTKIVQSRGGDQGIREEIEKYYSKLALLVPASLLSFFYLILFGLVYAQLAQLFPHDGSVDLAHAAGSMEPVVITFVGAYLFNMGLIVRRLYLYDLNDNLFWGCINRLLLSIGVSICLAVAFPDEKHNMTLVYFATPFILNKVLIGILHSATAWIGRLLNRAGQQADMPELQQICGINIWKEYRLEEEGIEEVQNLATADVIELAVKTHYNLRTLIDWIDQAIVLTRFGGKTQKMKDGGVNVSAVELAWQSPENHADPAYAANLAEILEMKPEILNAQLNAMFEDEYIQTLWTLWQTRDETGMGGGPQGPPPDGQREGAVNPAADKTMGATA